ncbi:MAG: hypothetical protein M3065_08045, partial [Actinomycetota bacterium]|nr:hypothetical protein [Actinomycetota bacterium]
SVHEAFDKFPSDYTPLALAPTTSGFPTSYCANDVETGTQACGSPYIMVAGSGVTVVSNVTLTPPSQTLTAGGSASLVANVTTSGGSSGPVIGGSVVFNVDSGPNVGKTFTGTTDMNGNTTFTYTDTGGAGTDSVSATYTDTNQVSQKATATVTWNVVTNPATAVKFATQPDNARVGQVISGNAYNPLGPPVTVDIVDAMGNIVTGSSAPVTVALQSNPGSATLGGTTTVNAVNGVATFSNLTVNKPGLGYTLAATSPGLTGATSSAFDVNTVVVACQENVNCSGTVSNPSINAFVTASGNPNAPDAGTLTVSLNVGPELNCPGFKAQGIGWVYFNVSSINRSKTLAYTITNPKAGGPLSGFQLCFGAPYTFTTKSGAPALRTVWSNGTVEFVGLLPNCPTRGKITGPCISSRTLRTKPTRVTINVFVPAGLPGDPRSHG